MYCTRETNLRCLWVHISPTHWWSLWLGVTEVAELAAGWNILRMFPESWVVAFCQRMATTIEPLAASEDIVMPIASCVSWNTARFDQSLHSVSFKWSPCQSIFVILTALEVYQKDRDRKKGFKNTLQTTLRSLSMAGWGVFKLVTQAFKTRRTWRPVA